MKNMVDLSRFKVVYNERVYKALALVDVEFPENTQVDEIHKKPKFIEILVINEDGNIEALKDEAWMFQFIPIVNG